MNEDTWQPSKTGVQFSAGPPFAGTLPIGITVVPQTLTLMNLVQLKDRQPPISSSRAEQKVVILRISVQVAAGRPRWELSIMDRTSGYEPDDRCSIHLAPAKHKMPSSNNG